MSRKNEYFKGKGKVWFDGELLGTATKSNFDNDIDYDEIDDPDGDGKVRVPLGIDLSGSVTLLKKDSFSFLQRLKENPLGFEFDAIVKEENKETGNFETVRYIDCTVDKTPISAWENKKITEVELAVKCRKYKIIA